MRISTITVYDKSISSLQKQQSNFVDIGQKIASGKRVMRPSDDPQAASRALGVSQSKAVTEQFASARVSARNSLAQSEGILNSIADAITRAKTLLVQGASDTLSDTDRTSIAGELKGVLETMLGQANATDGNGRYLFGGYRDSAQPFVRDANGEIQYVGDTNTREERIDSSRLMPIGDNGASIFQNVHSGAGYVAEADTGNAGSLMFTGPRIIDGSDPDYGLPFQISFAEDAFGDMTYSITDTLGNPLTPPVEDVPFNEGVITFGGLSLTLNGQPEDGDSLTVAPAQELDADLFRLMENVIAVLDSPSQTPEDRAALQNTLSTSMRKLDNSLDNILTVRASLGARLNELDIVDSVGEKRILNYTQQLSDLVDLDYVDAISEYSMRQIGLEAAQKAFVDITRLSLFNQL